MTDNEILGGLRNAIERGQSLEKAVQSFINAGYNARLVQEAANELSSGVTQIVNPSTVKENPIQPNSTQPKVSQFPIYQPVIQPSVQPPSLQPKTEANQLQGKAKKVVIALVITFTVLIAILLILILYKEKILLFLSS